MHPSDVPEPSTDGKNKKNLIKGVFLTSLFVFIVSALVAGWFGYYALTPGPEVTYPQATVFIDRGTSVEKIGGLLDEARLLDDDVRFSLLTRILGVSSKLPAGEFLLSTNQTPLDLINQLAAARPIQHSITIAEGLSAEEIAEIFAKENWVDKKRFIDLIKDHQFISEFDLGSLTSLEGYLFPDTYKLTRPTPGEASIIQRLVNRCLQVWNTLEKGDSRLSRHEVFTLASIVEKETGKGEERLLIASVFLNRLKRKMKLQSDPTVIYGIENFNGTLTMKDLKTPTPYNTYQISGLPSGPICSPGEDSLQAVLTPADSKYLYFVSKNDGSHQFSKNLREHNRAVRKYQR